MSTGGGEEWYWGGKKTKVFDVVWNEWELRINLRLEGATVILKRKNILT